MKEKNSYENLLIIGAVFFAAVMVIFPKQTEGGAKEGIFIWLNSVVPILFPFFIFSDFMKRMGAADRAPTGLYPFILAFMSGYPMGAKIVGEMVADGNLTREKGKWVLSYSLITGPAFILGALRSFLGSSEAAVIVAISHYLGAVINGMFSRGRKGEHTNIAEPGDEQPLRPIVNLSKSRGRGNPIEQFTLSIISSTRSMAIILAYLVVFMIGIEILSGIGFFALIESDIVASFFKGILEMTIGSNSICLSCDNMALKTGMVSFFVSFGGISVIGQSASMLGKSGISFFDVLQIKTTHGLISGIMAVILAIIVL